MRRLYHGIYWILTFVILTLTFRGSYGGLARSFYFVAFLFPVVVGTSCLLTSHLVPRFLFRKAYFRFALYFVYIIVFSVYLEMLVMTLTKEKLSTVMERLPDTFIRIHRSIVVNRDKIRSFNRELVTLEKAELPISRKYKNEANASLSQK